MSESPILTYRDVILSLVPRWLRAGAAGLPGTSAKVLYAIAIQLDSVGAALYAGVKRRFPGHLGQYDSLALLGKQRRIARGPLETDAGYATRLLSWLDDHQVRGNPYAMLRQLHGFWSGAFTIAIVNRTGKRFTLNTDGSIVRDFIVGWTDTATGLGGAPLARWRMYFDWPTPVTSDGLWGSVGSSGDEHWGDGGLWGVSLTPTEVQNIVLVPTEWNTGHYTGVVTLVPPAVWSDPTLWNNPGAVSILIN